MGLRDVRSKVGKLEAYFDANFLNFNYDKNTAEKYLMLKIIVPTPVN